MKAILLLCSGLLLMHTAVAEPGTAPSPTPTNGQKLFIGSPCDTAELTTPNPAITDKAGLEKEVRACDINHNINWYDDEVMDVVAYLNQTYYKFP